MKKPAALFYKLTCFKGNAGNTNLLVT